MNLESTNIDWSLTALTVVLALGMIGLILLSV